MKKNVFLVLLIVIYFFGCADTNDTSDNPDDDTFSPPIGVTVTGTTSSTISLTWNSVSDAEYYSIYYGATPIGTYEDGAYSFSGIAYSTSYTIQFLNPNTTYYIKIRSWRSPGELSQDSVAISGTTDSGTTPPTPGDEDFLTAYLTANENVISKMDIATDQNPNPAIWQYTIPGDISGNCIVIFDLSSPTLILESWDYNSYNDNGTTYTSPSGQEIIYSVDSSLNGSYTGTVNATGTYSGYIIYNLIITSGVTSGYYDVNGTIIYY